MLPRATPPDWFVPEINVSSDVMIAILDDDPSVHDAWIQRLSTVSEHLIVHHFSASCEF